MSRLTRCVAGIAIAAFSAFAHAQQWPTKQVRFIMPMPPGAAPDIVARLIGERLTKEWGHQAMIEKWQPCLECHCHRRPVDLRHTRGTGRSRRRRSSECRAS